MATRTETYVGGRCQYGGGSLGYSLHRQSGREPHLLQEESPELHRRSEQQPDAPVRAGHRLPRLVRELDPRARRSPARPSSGTPPVFDNNYPTRDNSVATSFDLTPASSYTCRVGPSGSPSGELSWNATTKVLTVSGTIFIDGSAKVSNSLAQYNGQAALYLSGTFLVTGKLCGGISGGNCDFASWNPNTEMLTVVTNSTGGPGCGGRRRPAVEQRRLPGRALLDRRDRHGQQREPRTARWSAPRSSSRTTSSRSAFGTITTVPVGQPGNPEVYAQPNPPQMFSG